MRRFGTIQLFVGGTVPSSSITVVSPAGRMRCRVATQRMPLDGLRSLAAFASSMASAYKAGSIPALNLVQASRNAVLASV
jgi:hypothetical protein